MRLIIKAHHMQLGRKAWKMHFLWSIFFFQVSFVIQMLLFNSISSFGKFCMLATSIQMCQNVYTKADKKHFHCLFISFPPILLLLRFPLVSWVSVHTSHHTQAVFSKHIETLHPNVWLLVLVFVCECLHCELRIAVFCRRPSISLRMVAVLLNSALR